MSKSAAAPIKVNVESLFREVQSIGSKCQQGIDELLKEQADIRRASEQRVQVIAEQVERLNELYHSATGRYYVSSKKDKAANADAGDKRQGRRSSEELKAQAEEVVDYLKTKGRDGAKAGEIKERFGKLSPGVKPFIEKHTDYKIKTEGAKAGTVYHIG
jgi:hypothetical protein